MFARLLITLVALPLAVAAVAQDRKRIDKAADLPVFSYKVDGKLEALVRDDAKFGAFARELRRDTDSVLAQYDIADKAKLRELLGVLVRLDLLEGRYDDALTARIADPRARGEARRQAAVRHCWCARSSRRDAWSATRRRTRTGARSRG